jgi:hypothetical protein
MMRIQIQLEPARHRQIKRRAKRLGVSVAEVIRQCIDAHLLANDEETREGRVRRARSAIGKYADPAGASHTARDHDRALADAYVR